MNRSLYKLDLKELKKNLNNSTNVNVLKKPKKVITRNVTKRVALVNKKPVKVTRRRTRTSSNSSQWDFLSVLLTIALLFFIGVVVYNIYLYLLVPQEVEKPQITIEDKVKKAPKGVIIDQEGAPISVEKGGDITEIPIFRGKTRPTQALLNWRIFKKRIGGDSHGIVLPLKPLHQLIRWGYCIG